MTLDELVAGLSDAWNAGDGERMAALFSDDAVFVDAPSGPRAGVTEAVQTVVVREAGSSATRTRSAPIPPGSRTTTPIWRTRRP